MNQIFALLLLVAIFASSTQAETESIKAQVSPLEVLIVPSSNVYSIKEEKTKNEKDRFYLTCIVKNISKEAQEIRSWSCSYYENWETNNKYLIISGWGCNHNGMEIYSLEPNQTKEWKLPVLVDEKTPEGDLKFRMTFVPCIPDYERLSPKTSATVWSDEMTIRVQR